MSSIWYFIFVDNGIPRREWWHYFTRKGFRHCLAIRPLDEDGAWQAVNCASQGLDVETIYVSDDPVAFVHGEGARVLRVEHPHGTVFRRRGILTCVSLLKHLIGLRGGWWVVTPWQLWLYLKRSGIGREVVRYEWAKIPQAHGARKARAQAA